MVPEFWEWIEEKVKEGTVRMPPEIWNEMKGRAAKKDRDEIGQWVSEKSREKLFCLEQNYLSRVQEVYECYSKDPPPKSKNCSNSTKDDHRLTESDLDEIGRDPFLIAAALHNEYTVVTLEVSAPSKKRQNRKIPDVCKELGIRCLAPDKFLRELGFKTR